MSATAGEATPGPCPGIKEDNVSHNSCLLPCNRLTQGQTHLSDHPQGMSTGYNSSFMHWAGARNGQGHLAQYKEGQQTDRHTC
jgi:hypothetical protein